MKNEKKEDLLIFVYVQMYAKTLRKYVFDDILEKHFRWNFLPNKGQMKITTVIFEVFVQ